MLFYREFSNNGHGICPYEENESNHDAGKTGGLTVWQYRELPVSFVNE
jgi:hypothetical protein